jgi:TPR repeat protein
MNENNGFALVPRPPGAIEKAEPGAMRILSGMVADTLALAHVGEAEAAFNRGCDYYNGNGVPLDYKLAAKYFRDAAEKGHAAAQDKLGFCYEFGKGVTEDMHAAVRWFRMAAEKGYAEAQFNLGWCYEKGEEYAEALRWYLKAAGQGNVWAQQWLGICYENGKSIVPQDYVEAAKWFRKAAEQGEAHSQYCLGVLLENGRGLAQDYVEAVRWYRKAAEQGHPTAQNNLGVCYEETAPQPRKSRPIRITMVCSEPAPFQSLEFVIRLWFKDATFRLFQDNGEEAWQELSRIDPDLLIMADVMPVLRGEEIGRRLLDRKATYPIIVTSAFDPTEVWVREFASRGLNVRFLAMPFSIEDVRKLLEASLKIPLDKNHEP